jgi:hypothetical protein
MKKDRPQVVWIARDYLVQDLINQYLEREIDYLTLLTQFRRNGWSTAGLYDVVHHQELERELNDWLLGKSKRHPE